MKKRILFIVFLISVFTFFSCEDTTAIKDSLAGRWNVTQIIGGFSQPKNYENEDFTWNFNFKDKTVTIINTSQPFDALYAPTFTNNRGGTYSFEVKTENNTDYLIVEDRKGEIKFTEEGLTIDYGIAFDDIAYIFER